jgi:hypothetical protein
LVVVGDETLVRESVLVRLQEFIRLCVAVRVKDGVFDALTVAVRAVLVLSRDIVTVFVGTNVGVFEFDCETLAVRVSFLVLDWGT